MSMTPVLLLDDAEFRGMVADELRSAGFDPSEAATIAEAEALVLRGTVRFEALILDVSFPDSNGCDLCARLRAARQHLPVLILAGSDAEDDVVRGLDAGAHDYLAKPVSPSVLIARLRAQLRHHEHSMDAVLTIEPWRFHPAQRLPRDQAGKRVWLTPREVGILHHLLRADGAASRKGLLAEVWSYNSAVTTHRCRRTSTACGRKLRSILAMPGC